MQTNLESTSFCQEIDRTVSVCVFTARVKIFHLQPNSVQNNCFAAFLFIVGTTLYSNSSQKRVPEEAAAHVNARIFYTRCFDVAKKKLLSELTNLFLI